MLYCTYPLEQYIVGFLSGAVLSWVMTIVYTSTSNSDDDEQENAPPEANMGTETLPSEVKCGDLSIPTKSVAIYVIDHSEFESFKNLMETAICKKASFPGLKPSAVESELDTMFDEALLGTQTQSEKIVPITKQGYQATPLQDKIGHPPSQQVVGGYRNLYDVAGCVNHTEPDGALSRNEERQIINAFSYIIQTNYYEALSKVQEAGYTLHPIYVSYGGKMPAATFSTKTIGVRIKDSGFDAATSKPSPDARIIEIIDIGGVDYRDHGVIKL